ncbi:MAG: hypothetical protein ABI811_15965 [Acidobacteriota bacterium]
MFEQTFVTPPSPFRTRARIVSIVASVVALLAQSAFLIFDLPKPWQFVPLTAWCVILGLQFAQLRTKQRSKKQAG